MAHQINRSFKSLTGPSIENVSSSNKSFLFSYLKCSFSFGRMREVMRVIKMEVNNSPRTEGKIMFPTPDPTPLSSQSKQKPEWPLVSPPSLPVLYFDIFTYLYAYLIHSFGYYLLSIYYVTHTHTHTHPTCMGSCSHEAYTSVDNEWINKRTK